MIASGTGTGRQGGWILRAAEPRPAARAGSRSGFGRIEQGLEVGRLDPGAGKGPADAVHEDEARAAVRDLLVVRQGREEGFGGEAVAADDAARARQADLVQMAADAGHVLLRAEAEPGGELEGERHAAGHRLAMQ